MGGSDDHVAIMGDWLPPSPFPKTFFSSTTSDDIASQSVMGFDCENQSGPPFPELEKHSAPGYADQNGVTQSIVGGNEAGHSNALSEPKLNPRGGLAERIAARAGFNALRLNTESIRPPELYTKPDFQSSYITIPPGLSPTTLLESPVFLSNSLVQPSPTTGKFPFVSSGNNRDSASMIDNHDNGKENTFEDINASSFGFKPAAESIPHTYFNEANESFPSVEVPVHSELQNTDPLKSHSNSSNALFQQANFCESNADDNGGGDRLPDQTYYSVGIADNSPPFDEQEDEDRRSGEDPNIGGSAGEDGYNWRKYGQKHVKGSEYPRSYYKCTHQNCPVKKKVERSHEGHITEIIYKGAHNHPKPPPNRRSAFGSSNALSDMQLDSDQRGVGETSDLIWSVMRNRDPLEPTSALPPGQEYNNGMSINLLAKSGAQHKSGDGLEESSTFSNNEDDDGVTHGHGSALLGKDGEGDDSEFKRRRIETYAPELTGATRAIREPRVVVQTTSEVDILDDGYRWRKYGQKVVKGNPNPRSYYKCTSPGCNVRKHVERASHDLKAVITTYEGKHNHDVPAARNSGNMNSGGPNTLPTQQAPVTRNHLHRPGPSPIRGRAAWFERPPLAPFGLQGRPQLGPGFGFGMNRPGLDSLGFTGFEALQYKLPTFPVQHHPMNEMAYMLPKEELKLEPVIDSGLNPSVGSAVYQQLMNRLPLGP